MHINNTTLVSEIVAANYTTASIFKKYKVDFCCNGNRTLASISKEVNISLQTLITEINDILKQSGSPTTYNNWRLDFLVDYIYENHHKYVEKQIPEILDYLDKIIANHSNKHPELHEIKNLFKISSEELTKHLKKEELLIFPLIKKLVAKSKIKSSIEKKTLKTLKNTIAMMHEEHDKEGIRFRKIEELTNYYTPPKNACNTYKITLSLLKAFQEDLHKHIHLENNILFKKVIEIEDKS